MAETSSTFSSSSILRYTGRVKWFNVKSGYGFITPVITHDEEINEDIFVHHTSILVGTEQYRYLVEGEYVDFNLERAEYTGSKNNFKFHAVNVTGVARKFLMCETKFSQVLAEQKRKSRPRPLRLEKTNYIHEDEYSPKTPRGRKTKTSSETPRGYEDTARDSDDDYEPEEEFSFPKQKRVVSHSSLARQSSRA
jgi:cold shock CspA family protein